MQRARRLYLYAIAAISLAVLATGVTNLLELLFIQIHDIVDGARIVAVDPESTRRSFSIHAALIIVALPIWLLHWWIIERELSRGGAQAVEERNSGTRLLYLTASLGIAFLFWAINGLNLLERLFASLLGVERPAFSRTQVETWFAITLVSGLIWIYHVWICERDMRAESQTRRYEWLLRFYTYAAAIVGAVLLIFGVADILALAVESVTGSGQTLSGDNWWAEMLSSALARVVGGLLIWGLHWGYATRRAFAPDGAIGARNSSLRRLYLYLIALICVFATLVLASMALESVFAVLLGAPEDRDPLARQIFEPVARAVPFVGFWLYHRQCILNEGRIIDEGARQATVRRIYTYAIALVGLAVASFGVAGIIRIVLDVILDRGSELTATSDLWRSDISRLGAIALVGAAAWLWHWYQVQQSIVTNPDAERSATVRRTFLFAVIAVSIIAVLSSLAVVIYRLLAAILNVTDVGPRSELHTPIAASIVAGMVLAYHAFILRDDLAARADEVASSMSFDLTISGPPDADVEEIVSTLRAHLPSGFTITRS